MAQQLLWLPALFVVVATLAYWLGRWARTGGAGRSTDAPLPRRCSNCLHFDLAEGQAVMSRYPSFLKAAAVLQPQEMGRNILRYDRHACDACEATQVSIGVGEVDFAPTDKTADCHVCRGNGYIEQPVFESTNMPAKARWTEFGACAVKETVLWGGDCCEQFVQLRVKP